MRITESRLRRIIKEEIANNERSVINESKEAKYSYEQIKNMMTQLFRDTQGDPRQLQRPGAMKEAFHLIGKAIYSLAERLDVEGQSEQSDESGE